MKVVVIGSKGMLGTDLLAACRKARVDAQGFDLPEIDITDYKGLLEAIPTADWVVNCAAYTRVDDAESDAKDAYLINCEGARHVARMCSVKRVRMLHVSTDYVFDGGREAPYTEEDEPNPISVYGASKLAGEKAVRAEGPNFLIMRTQSLFGCHGRNFVKSIAGQLRREGSTLRVVEDQVSAPTYTAHLADAMLRLMRLSKSGIVHVTASGKCSWFEFARAIADRVKPGAEIIPVTSASMSFPARRPPHSVLSQQRYLDWTGHTMPTWEEGLEDYLAEEKF